MRSRDWRNGAKIKEKSNVKELTLGIHISLIYSSLIMI